jgi:hypothetical protein
MQPTATFPTTTVYHRVVQTRSIALVGVLAALGLTGCGDNRSASRPMVLFNPTQLGDLYMDGQLTDTKGYRWDVAIIPGISPTFSGASDSYARAGGYIRRFGTDGLVNDGKSNAVGDMYRWAGNDCLGDYVGGGIGRDYRHTSSDIADLASDKPFGWYAQIMWRSTWGYFIKPVGRIVTGVPASAVVATVATAAGSFEGAGRGVVAVGDVAVMGTIYPAGRLLWHQPAYLVSIFNAEPALDHDGKWGLHIVGHPPTDAPKPPAPTATTALN